MTRVFILCFATLAVCAPNPQAAPSPSLAGSPSAAPSSSTISFPPGAPPNPYPNGLPTAPDVCDALRPSQECLDALNALNAQSKTDPSISRGSIWFDKNSQCDDDQKEKATTAAYEAAIMATFASNFKDRARGNQGALFYFGPDFLQYYDRINENLKRAGEFLTGSSSSYISLLCSDPKKICGTSSEGMVIAGYAWTERGWWGDYHSIALCSSFFTLDNLSEKIDQVESDLDKGDTTMATDLAYLRTTGQYFLHEMMHLKLVYAPEPTIIDEYVAYVPPGEHHSITDKRAYGPYRVRLLAKRSPGGSTRGGAERGSTNADTYAIFATADYFWEMTGHFPRAIRHDRAFYANATNATKIASDDGIVQLWFDANNITDMDSADFSTLLTDVSAGYEEDSDDDQSTAPPTPPVSSSTTTAEAPPPPSSPPLPPPPPPVAGDICGDWYKGVFDHFEIFGKNFVEDTSGWGEPLLTKLRGCGTVSSWTWKGDLVDDPNGYTWFASGDMIIGTKSCVGDAVVALGGSADGCTGAG